jgi:hypothetical protein
MDAVVHVVVVLQRDRAPLLEDEGAVAADQREPRTEVLRVGDGRRQRSDAHMARELDDDLLPHGTPLAVGEVVHLVEHDVAKPAEDLVVLVDHVAQDLGRHHDDRCAPVDAPVTREESDVRSPCRAHRSRYFWLDRALMGVV